jgi:hypothetical protein
MVSFYPLASNTSCGTLIANFWLARDDYRTGKHKVHFLLSYEKSSHISHLAIFHWLTKDAYRVEFFSSYDWLQYRISTVLIILCSIFSYIFFYSVIHPYFHRIYIYIYIIYIIYIIYVGKYSNTL